MKAINPSIFKILGKEHRVGHSLCEALQGK